MMKRTTDGTEVDFVLSQTTHKIAMECKLKRMDNPVNLQGFKKITNRYIVNRSLNATHNGTKFLQMFLAAKIN
jgi:hypothetical protein